MIHFARKVWEIKESTVEWKFIYIEENGKKDSVTKSYEQQYSDGKNIKLLIQKCAFSTNCSAPRSDSFTMTSAMWKILYERKESLIICISLFRFRFILFPLNGRKNILARIFTLLTLWKFISKIVCKDKKILLSSHIKSQCSLSPQDILTNQTRWFRKVLRWKINWEKLSLLMAISSFWFYYKIGFFLV